MHKKLVQKLDSPFKQEVYDGLSAYPKFLSSKYIYDKAGDKLFQDIMNMPEYYLTDTEFSILESYKEQLATLFASDAKTVSFDRNGRWRRQKDKDSSTSFYG